MSVTIDGSGTITGISTGGIPDGVVDTDVLADNAVTFDKIGTTEQGQLCKAWVNFDGTGTVAIRAAYNVSSITDNGTGNYTVNFTTALADASYAVAASAQAGTNAVTVSVNAPASSASPLTTTSFPIHVRIDTSSVIDSSTVSVAVFR